MKTGNLFCNVFLLGLLGSASMPLAPQVSGVSVFTPYVFAPLICVLILFWASQSGRIKLSYSAKMYVTFPWVMLGFVFLGNDQMEKLSATLPYVFGSTVFVVLVVLFRSSLLSWRNVVKFAYLFLLVESIIVVMQIGIDPSFGVVSRYFGEGEESVVTWGGTARVSGTFGNPNVFAQIYVLMASIVISQLLFSGRSMKMFGALWVMVGTGLVISISLSRSGAMFFVLVSIMMVYSFIRQKNMTKSKVFIGGAVGVFCFCVIVLAVFYSGKLSSGMLRFTTIESSGRLETYVGALKLALHPEVLLHGVGAGQFFEGAARYGIFFEYKSWVPVERINTSVHNLPLKILTESGLIVFALYFLAVAGFIRKAFVGVWRFDVCAKMMISWPLFILFLVPLQVGTSGASVWVITFVSVYFAVIECFGGKRVVRRMRVSQYRGRNEGPDSGGGEVAAGYFSAPI